MRAEFPVGVFAPNAKARAQVVAQRPVRPTAPVQVEAASAQTSLPLGDAVLEEARRRPPRLDFADLLRRTLGVDLFRCDSCGGRRSIIAFVKSEEEARKALGLIPRAAAPRPRATSPPQLALALA